MQSSCCVLVHRHRLRLRPLNRHRHRRLLHLRRRPPSTRRRRGANTLANRAVMLQGVSSMQHAVNTCIAVSYESGLTYEILLRLARSTQYGYSVGLVKSH
jgi:hypothetical protein